jgi:hypothetical protein
MPYRNQNKSSKQPSRRAVIIALLIVVLAVGSFLALRLRSEPANNANTSSSDSTETSDTPRPTTDKGQTEAPVPATETPTANPDNLPVTKPSGSFVSNHKPGQNGSPIEEESICITTPGASCVITFAMNGTTKSLQAVVADSTGTAYWFWTPASAGLTAGNWTVSAVATWGTQSATTQDPVPLEVSP